jgi:hypothetical protein
MILLADWGDPEGIATVGGLVTAVIALAALGVSLRAQFNAEADRRALREEQRQLAEERRRDRVRRVWIISKGITSGS